MSEKSSIRFERDGAIATLTVDQPESMNAITDEATVDALCAVFEDVQRDTSVRALIITGGGRVFSSGGNIKHMRDRAGTFAGNAIDVRNGYRRGEQRLPRALFELECPTIAAVNGPAIGAGLDFALMCDMRVASSNASFAESFVRVGIIPGDGGAWFLPRVVGWARAHEMALTGAAIDAQTAEAWGMVSRVVAPEELLPTARRIAEQVAANPPLAVRLTKRLLREAQNLALGPSLELAAAYQGALHQTEDHQEAVRAMLEKRGGIFHAR
jgi:enoyl-CoA hydratase/carnithine racemase